MTGGWWVTVRGDPPFRLRLVELPSGRLTAEAIQITGGHDGRDWIDSTTLRRVELTRALARVNALATAARIRAGEPVVIDLMVPL